MHCRWEPFEHGADVGLRGFGTTKAEAFEQTALAMTATAADPQAVQPRECIALDC